MYVWRFAVLKYRQVRLVRDSFWSFANTLLTGVVGTLISVIVARYLGPEETGRFSFALWFMSSAAIVLGLGLQNAVLRFGAEIRGKYGEPFAVVFLKRVLGVAMFLVAVWAPLLWLLLQFLHQYNVRLLADFDRPWLLIFGFGVYLFQGIAVAFVKSQRQFAFLTLINSLTFSLLTLGLLWAGRSGIRVEGFLFLYLIGLCGFIVLAMARYRRFLLSWKRLYWEEFPETWRRFVSYSLVVALIAVMDIIVWQRSEVFFLKWFGGPEEVAFYSIAYDLSYKLMRLIPGSVVAILLPVFSEWQGASEFSRLQRGYGEVTRFLALFSFPVAALMIVWSEPVIQLLYGRAFLPVVPVLQILLFSAAFAVVGGVGSSLVLALERQRFIFLSGVLVAVVNLGLDFWLIPSFGVIGAAVANFCSQLLGVGIGIVYLLTVVGVSFPFRDVGLAFVLAGIGGGMLYGVVRKGGIWLGLGGSLLVGLVVFAEVVRREMARRPEIDSFDHD